MVHSFTVRAKYADDITCASTCKGEINRTKATVPGVASRRLMHKRKMAIRPMAVGKKVVGKHVYGRVVTRKRPLEVYASFSALTVVHPPERAMLLSDLKDVQTNYHKIGLLPDLTSNKLLLLLYST